MNKYDIVKKARDTSRLSALEIIDALCSQSIELHGDRCSGDDSAIVAGIGMMADTPITYIGIQKGHTTKENIARNFGSGRPEGYRKAIRLMHQAEKFGRPVLTLINTSGADATPESEEHGIGTAIAESLQAMSELTVPTLAIILGEGGSGGAIALALADRVWMLENSTYSILSPEGFASILWKDAKLASKAAETMRLTSHDLLELGVIERIIAESDKQGNPYEKEVLCAHLIEQIQKTFHELQAIPVSKRMKQREARFKKF